MGTYKIAEVAARSGFTPATLRYYDDIGLVRPTGRTDAGYRLYDDASLERLRFVARAKQLGCSLDEITELSRAWDGGRCAHVQDRLRATIDAKVAESQRQVVELTALTAELRRAAAGLRDAPTGACDDTCGCLTDAPAPPPRTAVASPVGGDPLAGGGDGCVDAACACDAACAGDADDPVAVACSLDPASMGDRVDEWAALLAPSDDGRRGVVGRTAVDGGVRLHFGPSTDAAEVARLAAAEQACCPFFRFTLSLDAGGPALEVRAPAAAHEVVAALFGSAA